MTHSPLSAALSAGLFAALLAAAPHAEAQRVYARQIVAARPAVASPAQAGPAQVSRAQVRPSRVRVRSAAQVPTIAPARLGQARVVPVRHVPRFGAVTTADTSLRRVGVRSQTQVHPPPVQESAAPGHATCEVSYNGVRGYGLMEVRDGGRVIATGRCDGRVEVPAGRYDVTLTLLDALDRPQRTVPVTVSPGGVATARAAFATGILEPLILAGGESVLGNAIIYDGDRYVGSTTSGSPVTLSAGRYRVLVRHGRASRWVDVTLAPGQRRAVRASF